MKTRVFPLSLLLLVTLLDPARAAWIYVAPEGNDEAPGTRERPVRSLDRAQERARAEAGLHRECEVRLLPGTWRLTEPLIFGPEDSGVTWRAVETGSAIVSGGRELSGWTINGDGNWTLILPELKGARFVYRELFVNGRRATRARTPNDGFLRVEKAVPDRRTGFTFRPGEVATTPDLSQVELVFLHDWSITRVGVRSIDESAALLLTTDPIGGSAPHYAIDHFEPHPRYYLENSASYLDAPGEWFLDRTSGVLTYHPRAGENPETAHVVAPVANRLLEIQGTDQHPVVGLRFQGIHFEHCAWQIPEHGYAEGQANYHEPRTTEGGILRGTVPAALRFRLAQDCEVVGVRLAHLGGGGIALGSRTRNCQIRDCILTDISGNGIVVGEDTSRSVGDQPWWQAAPGQAAASNRVENCLVERCGRQFFGAVGIWVGLTRDTVIRRNEIRDLPYTGISLGWMWNPTPTPNGNNLVSDNHIHHVMQMLSDGGAIYTLGSQPGTILSGNHIHDIPVNLGRAESNGMFIDEGSTGILIEGNAIYNVDRSPLRFHQAGENRVRNNLLVLKEGVPPIRYNSTPEGNVQQTGNVIAMEGPRQP